MRVPVVAVALCLAPALVFPQSLGDAARQQSRKRAERPPAARVFTEADLHPGAGVADTGGPAPPSATAERGGKGSPPPSEAFGRPAETEGEVRARLDREADERREREDRWRGLARYTRARLQVARRERDLACGPGAVVLSGG